MTAAENLPDDTVAIGRAIRDGRLSGHISGMAGGFVPGPMLSTDPRHAG